VARRDRQLLVSPAVHCVVKAAARRRRQTLKAFTEDAVAKEAASVLAGDQPVPSDLLLIDQCVDETHRGAAE